MGRDLARGAVHPGDLDDHPEASYASARELTRVFSCATPEAPERLRRYLTVRRASGDQFLVRWKSIEPVAEPAETDTAAAEAGSVAPSKNWPAKPRAERTATR